MPDTLTAALTRVGTRWRATLLDCQADGDTIPHALRSLANALTYRAEREMERRQAEFEAEPGDETPSA